MQTNEVRLGALVNRLSHLMHRRFNSDITKYGITAVQANVLHFILMRSLRCDVYQRDVEEEFDIRRSSVTSVLQLMERSGFIIRESVEHDARLKKITLTEKAKELQPLVLEDRLKVETDLLRGITPEELETYRRITNKMLENMKENAV